MVCVRVRTVNTIHFIVDYKSTISRIIAIIREYSRFCSLQECSLFFNSNRFGSIETGGSDYNLRPISRTNQFPTLPFSYFHY